jgi:hypothetical protein
LIPREGQRPVPRLDMCQRRRRTRAKTPRLHHHDGGRPPRTTYTTPPTPPSDIEPFSNTFTPLRAADQKQNARVFCFASLIIDQHRCMHVEFLSGRLATRPFALKTDSLAGQRGLTTSSLRGSFKSRFRYPSLWNAVTTRHVGQQTPVETRLHLLPSTTPPFSF